MVYYILCILSKQHVFYSFVQIIGPSHRQTYCSLAVCFSFFFFFLYYLITSCRLSCLTIVELPYHVACVFLDPAVSSRL